jgi:NAD-dependent SIR2 family protein deacetylase
MTSELAHNEHWEYKLEGWNAFGDANPNAVHSAIFELESSGKLSGVVTQNIDGLHRMAGTSAELLVKIHETNSQIEC